MDRGPLPRQIYPNERNATNLRGALSDEKTHLDEKRKTVLEVVSSNRGRDFDKQLRLGNYEVTEATPSESHPNSIHVDSGSGPQASGKEDISKVFRRQDPQKDQNLHQRGEIRRPRTPGVDHWGSDKIRDAHNNDDKEESRRRERWGRQKRDEERGRQDRHRSERDRYDFGREIADERPHEAERQREWCEESRCRRR